MGINDYLYNHDVYISLVGLKGIIMFEYFNWLSFEWLMKNLEWIGAGMFLSLGILLFFPIMLTLEFKKLNKNKD